MFTSAQSRTLDALIENALNVAFPAAQVEVLINGERAYARAAGYLDPETRRRPTALDTRFDLASLSMLFTTTAFMSYVDEGLVSLDQPVRDLLPEFSGLRKIAAHPRRNAPGELVEFFPSGGVTAVDTRRVTFRHLLAHNSGLPAWLPLHIVESDMRADGRSGVHIDFALRDMVTGTLFAYPPGERVVFSDVGYLLLGFVLERIGRKPLRQVLRERVVDPLGLLSVCFGSLPCEDVAPTEFDNQRQQHICGESHDQNAAALGGVAGHSGLFAHARDVARLGEMYRTGGAPLLSAATVAEMTRLQAEDDSVRRGLGFAVQSKHELASSAALSSRAFGHLGFTGTSLWIDPERNLSVAILTNHAYYGNVNDEAMNAFRRDFHRALVEVVDGGQ